MVSTKDEVMCMKRTDYKVLTNYSMDASRIKWNRVYEDSDGLRYIRSKEGYKCIENTPCLNYISRV